MSTPRYYLRQIYAERYGAFSKRELGPFKPGLNVVFGPNEAGKSTYSSLVNGVLFGWEDAHGVRNTYQPQEGERSGMLTFASETRDLESGQSLVRITRVGDDPQESAQEPLITGDVDQAIYRTMFSFSSDELRSLDNTNDVTARLLSAGTGTAVSPSSVYLELEQRIATLTSLSPDASDSIITMTQQLENARAHAQEEARYVEQLKQNDRELRELLSNRADAETHLNELDHTIEQFTKAHAELGDIDARLMQLHDELKDASREHQFLGQQKEEESDVDERLLNLDANDVRRLNDRLDEFEAEREKIARMEDAAKENSAKSTAGYEAMVELARQQRSEDSQAKEPKRKATRAVASSVPTVIFMAAGIALFIYGRRIGSLSFTVLALSLIALAFILGIAAAMGVRRMARNDANLENRIKDAQWVMLQDKKRLDSSHAEMEDLTARIRAFLEESGLGQAEGSLRHARALLSDAQEIRQQKMQDEQRDAAALLRMEAVQQEIDQLKLRRARWEERLQMPAEVQLDEIEQALQAKIAQRTALRAIADETNSRIGQLRQELKAARDDTTFDQVKLEAELTRTRLREAKEQLAELLLARRMLERAMVSWEGDNQPRVYEEASRLLTLITGGRWVGVSTSVTGSIVAIDRDGDEVKPRHLSLGTCQQLYLALRVALLLTAQDVGASIPVIADDILVHFDEQRRVGAARVLVELARSRQVIIFTCHQETVEALRAASSEESSDLEDELNYLAITR